MAGTSTGGSDWNPLSLRGTIARGPFALWGLVLALVKFGVDRWIVRTLEHRSLSPWEYWFPGNLLDRFPFVNAQGDAGQVRALVALAFVCAGVTLVLRRATDAGLSPWLVLTFFVPVANLITFVVLALAPRRTLDGDGRPAPRGPARDRGVLPERFAARLPEDKVGSACVTALVVTPLAVGGVWFSAEFLRDYGFALFLGLPFAVGMLSTLVYGARAPRTLNACLLVTMLALAMVAGVLVLARIEGMICILMAFPIAAMLAVLGTVVGHQIHTACCHGGRSGPTLAALVLTLPAAMLGESAADWPPPRSEVTTTVEVDAPPESVWEHVVAFAELPPPEELIFRLGVAYPLRAEIHGEGPGAVRHCVFSTGPFVEPIEVWDAPRRLEFSVSAQPPSMRELSPWPDLAPPHLERFLVSERGRFLLEPLPGGRTRLSGTTWYSNRMWPAAYWTLWSDGVIGAIHGRVLRHIKARAEAR